MKAICDKCTRVFEIEKGIVLENRVLCEDCKPKIDGHVDKAFFDKTNPGFGKNTIFDKRWKPADKSLHEIPELEEEEKTNRWYWFLILGAALLIVIVVLVYLLI